METSEKERDVHANAGSVDFCLGVFITRVSFSSSLLPFSGFDTPREAVLLSFFLEFV